MEVKHHNRALKCLLDILKT